jgi:hypothetical protein
MSEAILNENEHFSPGTYESNKSQKALMFIFIITSLEA